MSGTLLPPLIAAAAITCTYVFCVRPMRQGRGCYGTPRSAQAQGSSRDADTNTGAEAGEAGPGVHDEALDAEIARLRGEAQFLYHKVDVPSMVSRPGAQGPGPLDKEGRC